MLVRIKGVVDDIIMQDGVSKENKPWAKKVYVIKDNTYNKDDSVVYVNDFGKLDPSKMNPEFVFKSMHSKGEEVDLACYLETNKYGFTNVNYGKPYEEIEKPKESNVIKPDAQPATEAQPVAETAPVDTQVESSSDLPF